MANRFAAVALIGLTSFLGPLTARAQLPNILGGEYLKLPMSFEPNRGQFDERFGFASLGHHNKLIAYDLGISHSTVNMKLYFASVEATLRAQSL